MTLKLDAARKPGGQASTAMVATVLALFVAQSAPAQRRLGFPNPDPGGPVYARVERPFLVHTRQILWTTCPFPGPPNQVFTRGTGAVPVWFVAWPELESALSDNRLTIGELRAMRSLQIGHAIRFEETLLLTQQAQTLAINMVARGELLDGRPFEFEFSSRNGRLLDIQIKLGSTDRGPNRQTWSDQ
jgi:hypothetical protein